MGLLKRNKCNIAFQKEAGVRLDPTTLSEDDLVPFDLIDDTVDIPEAFTEFSEMWAVNGGRNMTNLVDEGVPVLEFSLPFEMQTGISLYYAVGKCVTTVGEAEVFTVVCEADVAGSLHNKYWLFTLVDEDGNDKNYYVWYTVTGETPNTDPALANKTGLNVTIASGAAATAVATATALVIDALTYAGCPAPGAATITVTMVNSGQVTDAADGDTGWAAFAVTNQGVDNVHAISEDDDTDPPSLAVYFEQLFTNVPLLKNSIGCFTSELEINIVKDAHVKGNWSFKIPKTITSTYESGAALATWGTNTVGDGSNVTSWAEFQHKQLFNVNNPNLKVLEFANAQGNFTLTLDVSDHLGNGAITASAWNIESCKIRIANDLELLPVMNDECFKDPDFGKREYEITLFIYPQDTYDTLRRLRASNPEDYYCSLTVKLARSERDSIEMSWTRLFVKEYPNKIPEAVKSLGVELVLKASPGNGFTATIKDPLGKKFYEVS